MVKKNNKLPTLKEEGKVELKPATESVLGNIMRGDWDGAEAMIKSAQEDGKTIRLV